MNTTILLLTFNGAHELADTFQQLLPLPAGFELLVLDNGSRDASVALARSYAAAHERITVVELGRNHGFSGGMNIGIQLATGQRSQPAVAHPQADYVVLLNQDTQVQPGWHAAVIAPFADDPAIGAVGCLIYQRDGRTVEHLGAVVEPPRAMTRHIQDVAGRIPNDLLDVEYATGAALALRVSALNTIGLFDERYNPAYCEEIDLCNRLHRAGYRVVVNPAARVIHETGATGEKLLARLHMFHRGRLLYLYKTAPITTLINQFAPAEHAFIENHAGQDQFVAHRAAYTDALLRFDDWMVARTEYQGAPPSAQDQTQLRQLLRDLRQAAITQDYLAIARMLQ